jgi:two-component system OmpR family response regulator
MSAQSRVLHFSNGSHSGLPGHGNASRAARIIGTSASPSGSQPDSQESIRVFLVEDLPAVRTLVIENLEEIEGLQLAGYAETEAGAVDWLGHHDCEVLILDLELREGNGIGVLKQLAATGEQPGLVKIIYSNHVGPNIRRLASKFGASYFFDKSLDTPQLRTLLESLSSSRAAVGGG